MNDAGVEVAIADGAVGFIRKADLARDRSDQRPDRFAVGEKVDAKITNVDRKSRKLSLSIKAREIEEEKEAMDTYGSSDSGASLGEILGAALSQAKQGAEEKAEPKKAAAKPKKAATKAKKADDAADDKADEKAEGEDESDA